MKFSAAALSASLVAFASGAAAQLQVYAPGGPNLWWGQYIPFSYASGDSQLNALWCCVPGSRRVRQRRCLDMPDVSLHELYGLVSFPPSRRMVIGAAQRSSCPAQHRELGHQRPRGSSALHLAAKQLRLLEAYHEGPG